MKKHLFRRILAMCMALSLLSTTAFAASFDDLQNAIDGNTDQGFQIENSGYQDHYGYGTKDETTGSYGVESWTTDGTTNVTLNEDVDHSESDTNTTITVDGNVNLDLNGNDITGDGEHTVIEVEDTGDLTITGGEDGTNTIGGGSTGIDVSGELTLDGVTVSGNETGVNVNEGGSAEIRNSSIVNNDIGVAFVDDLSVTFTGSQNQVSGNTTKNIAGTGKVTFKLDETEYKVDAKTAETLLADKDNITAHGDNWILAKNDGDEETYTVVYTGSGDKTGKMTSGHVSKVYKAIGVDGTKVTEFIVSGDVTEIGGTFNAGGAYSFKNLKRIQLSESVKIIGESAFQSCANLEDVNIPESVTKIGKNAFYRCENLAIELKLPDTLTELGANAFVGCAKMTGDVKIPAGITEIGTSTFSGCAGLSTIQLLGDVTTIGTGAFLGCSGLESINLPETVTKIGDTAFQNCRGLAIELKLPEGLTYLGNQAFDGCVSITGVVTIPAGVEELSATFNSCENLTGIVFAEGSKCTSIKFAAFSECKKLKSISIPDGVTSFGSKVFAGCSDLETITIPASLSNIAGDKNSIIQGSGVKSIFIRPVDGYEESSTAKFVATKTDVNIFIEANNENLSFYRDNVTADFAHTVNETVNRTDGSVELTNVSGTITVGDNEVTLPDVAGISVSIDTAGNITVRVPITVGDDEYPNGAIIHPDGTVEELPAPAPDDSTAGDAVIDFNNTFTGTADGTTISDNEVPLAGLITVAQLLDYLHEHDGIADAELPEDFQWIDHEYAQAIYWGLQEELVVDTEEEPLDPDEILTVAILREIMPSYAQYLGTTFDVVLEDEDDMIVMNCDEILAEFYDGLEDAAA